MNDFVRRHFYAKINCYYSSMARNVVPRLFILWAIAIYKQNNYKRNKLSEQ